MNVTSTLGMLVGLSLFLSSIVHALDKLPKPDHATHVVVDAKNLRLAKTLAFHEPILVEVSVSSKQAKSTVLLWVSEDHCSTKNNTQCLSPFTAQLRNVNYDDCNAGIAGAKSGKWCKLSTTDPLGGTDGKYKSLGYTPPLPPNANISFAVETREPVTIEKEIVTKKIGAFIEKKVAEGSSVRIDKFCKLMQQWIKDEYKGSEKIELDKSSDISQCAASGNTDSSPAINKVGRTLRKLITEYGQGDFVDENQLRELKEELIDKATAVINSSQLVYGNTNLNYDSTAFYHLSFDGGIAVAWDIDEIVPYMGMNIYSVPVNRDIPLATLRSMGLCKLCWRQRVSATIGVTLSSLDESGKRSDSLGSNSLLFGLGIRWTDLIRLNAGAIMIEEDDRNPLVDDPKIKATPYFGVSLDWDIAKSFKGSLGEFFKEK